MFAYCVSAAYQEAASVARHRRQRCASRRAPKGAVEERIHRGAGSGASTDVLREIGAPCREIGVELDVYPREVVRPPAEPAPLHSKRTVDRLRSPRGGSRISPGFISNACGCRIGDQESRPMNESVATPIVENTKVARTRAAERMARYRQRRRSGMRCLMIELRREEVAWLVRHRWLAPESRSDLNAVKRALYAFLDDSLR